MNWKIIFIFLVLFFVIGAGCENESAEKKPDEIIEDDNIESKDSEYYDGLDDALAELDELEEP